MPARSGNDPPQSGRTMLVDAGMAKLGHPAHNHKQPESRLLFYIPNEEAVELLSHFRKEEKDERIS